ncbi:deoxyguanosinetriphosphate triphosphohydrolase family protein [Amycolatopsis sp. RTGN1]|uniref:deoxyguanosinetriphosphate triphosphohydrolase family protein n=1 Tax=Amycolatopsis ponsaeliensis TaxID=2992142 RepID=UPI00254D8781|nr:dNTP triphosphohydrolase [Amycolatopsis sp. RTGN1]
MATLGNAYQSFDAKPLHAEESDADEYRNPFQRDRDRVLYSSAFRRLAGVTQVAAVREQALLHNRLTHSLKVAQLARSMAQRLLTNENFTSDLEQECHPYLPDIAETAGLAHDLGHPPFGHIAEKVLNVEMEDYGGFEGNAQSFRIVTKLASRKLNPYGLNLTRASLNSILKYPQYRKDASSRPLPHVKWSDRSRGRKWGAYLSEERDFDHAREQLSGAPRVEVRSVAAILMDWADDVSFATHDLDDYYRGGLIPLNTLRRDDKEFLDFARVRNSSGEHPLDGYNHNEFMAAYERLLRSDPPRERFEDTRDQRVRINQWISDRIKKYVRSVECDCSEDGAYLRVDESSQYEVEVLKTLNWYHVINKPALAVAQHGQKRIMRRLFQALFALVQDNAERIQTKSRAPVPITLQEIYRRIIDSGIDYGSEEEIRARAVCDYICGLTEDQTVDLYERLTGRSVARNSIFGAWFH